MALQQLSHATVNKQNGQRRDLCIQETKASRHKHPPITMFSSAGCFAGFASCPHNWISQVGLALALEVQGTFSFMKILAFSGFIPCLNQISKY